MAVEKLASGRIFVSAPYKRTAAENYVSTYTKSRAEEFERAQKDARDEAELQKLEYKAQLAAYQERIKSAERQRAKLADLRARTQNKEMDDATALLRLEATLAEKYAGREDAMDRARAEVRSYTRGGTTTTTQTGTATTVGGGGGGSGGARPKSPDLSPSPKTDEQIRAKLDIMGTGPDAASAESQYDTIVGSLGTAGGIQTTDPDDRRKALGQMTERLASDYEGGLIAVGVDPASARVEARAAARARAVALNPANAELVDRYYADMDRVEADAAGTGAPQPPRVTERSGTQTTVSDKDVGFYRPRGTLGEANVPGQVDLGPPPSREQVLAAIDEAERNIPQVGDVPRAPVVDSFTRGRTLYSERFGPSVPMQPFQSRRTLDILRGLPPEMQASIGAAYRDYLAQQEAQTAPTTPTVPTEAVAAPAAAPTAGAPEAAPARFGQSGMGETFPYESEIVAAESGTRAADIARAERGMEGIRLELEGLKESAPPEPAEPRIAPTAAPPPPPVEDPETRALRQQAMAAVQAREVAAKKAELQALIGKRAADRATVDALLANVPSATPMPEMPPMAPPPAPERRTLPQFTPPEQRAAPVNMPQVNTAEARKRALEMAALGMKPEGELMATPPAAPSAAMAAPKAPAAAPPGYLKAKGPLATKAPADIERETDEKILRIAEVMEIQKQLVSDPKFLERTLKTKAGDIAARVYRANAEAKKGLNATQNALVDEFMGNTDDMKVALAVAYALDSLSKPKSPAEALKPQE